MNNNNKKINDIKKKNIRKLLKNSYLKNQKKNEIENLHLDKKKSNLEHQLYVSPENKATVVISGSRKGSDLITDVGLAVGLLNKTQRYKREKEFLDKVNKKYGENNVKVLGNSLGGSLALELTNRKNKGTSKNTVIAHNPGLSPISDFGTTVQKHQTIYRSPLDVVSLFSLTKKNKHSNIRNQKIKSYNLISEHLP